MILIYGEVGHNTREAIRVYTVRFPQRRVPHRRTDVQAVQRIADTGNVMPSQSNAGRAPDLRSEERILQLVREEPSRSSRQIVAMVGVSHSTGLKTLREDLQRPYHLQRVPYLVE